MEKRNITRKVVNDYLAKGAHVHIKDVEMNPWQTIFALEVTGGIVISRTFISHRDKPNRGVANMVVVGRVIRAQEKQNGIGIHIHGRKELEDWLNSAVYVGGEYMRRIENGDLKNNYPLSKMALIMDGLDFQTVKKIIYDFKTECEDGIDLIRKFKKDQKPIG